MRCSLSFLFTILALTFFGEILALPMPLNEGLEAPAERPQRPSRSKTRLQPPEPTRWAKIVGIVHNEPATTVTSHTTGKAGVVHRSAKERRHNTGGTHVIENVRFNLCCTGLSDNRTPKPTFHQAMKNIQDHVKNLRKGDSIYAPGLAVGKKLDKSMRLVSQVRFSKLPALTCII